MGRAKRPVVVDDGDAVRGQEIEPLLDRPRRHGRPPPGVNGPRRVRGFERDHRVPVFTRDGLLERGRARVPRPRFMDKLRPDIECSERRGQDVAVTRRLIVGGDDGTLLGAIDRVLRPGRE